MKRLISLAVLSAVAVFAASRSETTTYVDGNLTGVAPNTGGTLTLNEEKAMYFHTGLSNIAVPYEGISKVELGAVKETSHDVPLYKVWALHKRFSGGNKTETQLVIVGFKNEEGEEKSMTLELEQSSAKSLVATLEERTGKTFASASKKTVPNQAKGDSKPADGWWGDDYWKTTRNADKWNKSASNNNQQ